MVVRAACLVHHNDRHAKHAATKEYHPMRPKAHEALMQVRLPAEIKRALAVAATRSARTVSKFLTDAIVTHPEVVIALREIKRHDKRMEPKLNSEAVL